jgi:hypothetical protein
MARVGLTDGTNERVRGVRLAADGDRPVSVDAGVWSERAMTRAFVTGALGFIGGALAERMRAEGMEVRGVDVRADAALGVVAGDVSLAGEWQRHVQDAIWSCTRPRSCHCGRASRTSIAST